MYDGTMCRCRPVCPPGSISTSWPVRTMGTLATPRKPPSDVTRFFALTPFSRAGFVSCACAGGVPAPRYHAWAPPTDTTTAIRTATMDLMLMTLPPGLEPSCESRLLVAAPVIPEMNWSGNRLCTEPSGALHHRGGEAADVAAREHRAEERDRDRGQVDPRNRGQLLEAHVHRPEARRDGLGMRVEQEHGGEHEITRDRAKGKDAGGDDHGPAHGKDDPEEHRDAAR